MADVKVESLLCYSNQDKNLAKLKFIYMEMSKTFTLKY